MFYYIPIIFLGFPVWGSHYSPFSLGLGFGASGHLGSAHRSKSTSERLRVQALECRIVFFVCFCMWFQC